jgi:hypothetical protein
MRYRENMLHAEKENRPKCGGGFQIKLLKMNVRKTKKHRDKRGSPISKQPEL